MLNALVTLHSKKLIHRDVKSANVFYECLDGKMNYVLGDFGESKILKNKVANTLTGTSRWIAPEVFDRRSSKGYSFEADVWSFGMLLYELMTLKLPFFETGLGVESLIIDGKIPTLTEAQSCEYAFLFTLFNNCVTYDPAKRWSALEALSHVQTLKDIVGV